MVIVLSENDVSALSDMPSAIQKMEEAFLELDRKRVLLPQRYRISIPDSVGTIRLMAAVLQDSKVSGLKVLAGTAGRRRIDQNYFLVLLLDYNDGAIQCIMSANRLTQLRTGAISAVAAKLLARKDSKTLGIIGAGVQGRGQLEAIRSVLQLEKGYVYDVSQENAKRLADFAKEKLHMSLEVVDKINSAATADIVVTATTSNAPFLYSSIIRPGTHISAIGSNLPNRKELDVSLIKSGKVVVDSKEQAIEESGDFEPIRLGVLKSDVIYADLAEIVGGSKKGRVSDSEITIFKSVGTAIQDIAIAKLVYENALKKGIGVDLKL